ncbi:hypothetical protein BDV33DRAFT_170328 [Aspergillus novoparasiticus]|uniref:Aminoglycoside phosphotransferase domain-containing protein n=1 Tax=Aspergillus novoparasiticus TaxID=986946 RepID=A0A5N6EXF8_9EURO|nr:hypothetical protein BDV33DRAFT_170328 [Aspergillus novoparasiticus]
MSELLKFLPNWSLLNLCVSSGKLGEGSYNKSFRLIMDNGKVVVARIPNPNARPTF